MVYTSVLIEGCCDYLRPFLLLLCYVMVFETEHCCVPRATHTIEPRRFTRLSFWSAVRSQLPPMLQTPIDGLSALSKARHPSILRPRSLLFRLITAHRFPRDKTYYSTFGLNTDSTFGVSLVGLFLLFPPTRRARRPPRLHHRRPRRRRRHLGRVPAGTCVPAPSRCNASSDVP